MTQFGCLKEFDENNDEFKLYVERFEQFLLANAIKDEQRAAIFLSTIGARCYKLLRNLLQPILPKDASYMLITATLSDYLKPQGSVIAERFRFHKRNQADDEDVSTYVVELKRLAASCEFEGFLEQALRDRLVCGIKNETVQRRLLAKKSITFAEATEMALSVELAERNTYDMKGQTAQINAVKKGSIMKKEKTYMQRKEIEKGKGEDISSVKCYRCGYDHYASKCRHVKTVCNLCRKVGHIAAVCRSKRYESQTKQQNINARVLKQEDDDDESWEYENLSLYSINKLQKSNDDYLLNVEINNKQLSMLLDSAADTTTISESWYVNNIPEVTFSTQKFKLRDYGEHAVEVLGIARVSLKCADIEHKVNVAVVAGDKPALFGKDCIRLFKPELHRQLSEQSNGPTQLHAYKCSTEVKPISIRQNDKVETQLGLLLTRFNTIFEISNKPIKKFIASIALKEDAKPIYKKARPVPFALKPILEKQIRQQVEQGIWDFVSASSWATPLVLVPKKDNKLRMCGDFKITVNVHTEPEVYPLPTQKELFAALNNGVYFSKLDMRHAYNQIALDEKSKDYLTLNTHMGLLRPHRLQFGINNASQIFQSVMDKLLNGIQNIICYQDDILVISRTIPEHFQTLKELFERLDAHNVKLNRDKCKFLQKQVEYLGHMIDDTGIHPTSQKVEAIASMKAPQNVHELQVFLGILNYYIKFIKNAAELLHPLHNLLRKGIDWEWTEDCAQAFISCKKALSSSMVLTHYDNNKKLSMACDASPYGLGVVLSHVIDMEDRPIAYASRTLTKAERSYSHIEKEALSIIFGLKHFHQYIYGRSFTIITDHRPLIKLFGPKSEIPTMAAARIQRWALLLSSYNYDIRFKKGREHANADTLSRFPCVSSPIIENNIFKLSFMEDLPITGDDVRLATRKDPILGRVVNGIKYGWHHDTDIEMMPYYSKRDELSIQDDCLLWGMRVVIPKSHRARLLELLHDTHPGISRMKSIAHSHIWWPGIDNNIETCAKTCRSCEQSQRLPSKSALQSWIWPKKPWERIHIDYGQKGNQYFLIIYDAHSKWIEVIPTSSMTSNITMKLLRYTFSRYGLPLELVSDNGPQLTSTDFEKFLKVNGIKHTLVPPYHPSSNGAAERSVQSFKAALSKMDGDENDSSDLHQKVARYMMVQHNTPHATTGVTPAALFIGRELRDRWALLHMDLTQRVEHSQFRQKINHDGAHARQANFDSGCEVLAVNGINSPKWLHGVIVGRQSSKTWWVKTEKGTKLFHSDQLRHKQTDMVRDTTHFDHAQNYYEDVMDNANGQYKHDESTAKHIPDRKPNQEVGEEKVKDLHKMNPILQHVADIVETQKSEISERCKNPVLELRRNPPRERRVPDRLNL